MNFFNRIQPYLLSLLRIAAAYMFILHGTAKLFGLPHVEGMSGVPLMSIYGLAAILEVVGGGLLLLGLFTRPAAFILSGEMAVAYFMAHAKTAPLLPLLNGGESAALFSFVFLYLSAAGGGAWSLDKCKAKTPKAEPAAAQASPPVPTPAEKETAMTYQNLLQAAETRRSVYALNKNLPIAPAEAAQIIEHAVKHTPSAFNSQSTRVVVLFGAEHEKLWQFAEEALRAIVAPEDFEPTAQKLALFKAAAGSVLFFEDQSVIKGLQEKFPPYADNFPVWAEHADAMHQYAVWTTLAAAGIGANLQHYNPLIDAAVAKEWGIPESWTLRAQMVFGGIAQPAGEKSYEPLSERFKTFGA